MAPNMYGVLATAALSGPSSYVFHGHRQPVCSSKTYGFKTTDSCARASIGIKHTAIHSKGDKAQVSESGLERGGVTSQLLSLLRIPYLLIVDTPDGTPTHVSV